MGARSYQESEREWEGEQHVTLACDAVALLHTAPHASIQGLLFLFVVIRLAHVNCFQCTFAVFQ